MEAKCKETYPLLLHRYMSFKRGYEFISKKRLRLSSIEIFNDPFEFLPRSEYTQLLIQKSPEDLQKDLYTLLNKKENKWLNKLVNPSDPTAMLALATGAKLGIALGALLPLVAVVSVGFKLYSNNKKLQREEINKLKSYVDNYFLFVKRTRLSCFSEDHHNILMWSHYADCHRGMAISIDPSIELWGGKYFNKVNYYKERVDIPFSQSNNGFIEALITTKAEFWSYEKEWRYIKHEVQNTPTFKEKGFDIHYVNINPRVIRAIYLGMKMPEVERKKIIQYRDKYLKEVVIYQVIPNAYNYTLDFNVEKFGTDLVRL